MTVKCKDFMMMWRDNTTMDELYDIFKFGGSPPHKWFGAYLVIMRLKLILI